jgi:hypothetical protein
MDPDASDQAGRLLRGLDLQRPQEVAGLFSEDATYRVGPWLARREVPPSN